MKFRAVNAGEAIFSAKKKVPIGTTVTYGLSAAGPVAFTVERKTDRPQSRAEVRESAPKPMRPRRNARCIRKVKGGFSATGASGQNKFKFSGRISGKGLKPGRYRLVGSAGGVTKG